MPAGSAHETCLAWFVQDHATTPPSIAINLVNVWLGSVAVVQADSSLMAALGCRADIQLGRMSALTETGRSEILKLPKLNGS